LPDFFIEGHPGQKVIDPVLNGQVGILIGICCLCCGGPAGQKYRGNKGNSCDSSQFFPKCVYFFLLRKGCITTFYDLLNLIYTKALNFCQEMDGGKIKKARPNFSRAFIVLCLVSYLFTTACAAANLAMGTLNGEQDT